MTCVSLSLSLYLCVFLFVFWRELEHSCAREMLNADQAIAQGGTFMVVGWGIWADPETNNAIFKTQSFTSNSLRQKAAITRSHPFYHPHLVSRNFR